VIKLIQVYQDYDGEVKADFVDKRSGAAFTTNEAQLQLRINDNRGRGLDVRVEEVALNFIQRWPYYAAEVSRQRNRKGIDR
jgi:hypothetical protein